MSHEWMQHSRVLMLTVSQKLSPNYSSVSYKQSLRPNIQVLHASPGRLFSLITPNPPLYWLPQVLASPKHFKNEKPLFLLTVHFFFFFKIKSSTKYADKHRGMHWSQEVGAVPMHYPHYFPLWAPRWVGWGSVIFSLFHVLPSQHLRRYESKWESPVCNPRSGDWISPPANVHP